MTAPHYRTYGKAASTPQQPLGVWRGRIEAVDGAVVDVSIPRIAGSFVYKGIEAIGFPNTPMYSVGDAVYVAFIEGSVDDLLVLGPVRRPSYDTATGASSGPQGADALIFSWPGQTIPTTETGRAPMPRDGIATEIQFTFNEPGSTATVVEVLVNATVVATYTIPAFVDTSTQEWEYGLTEEDLVSMRVTTAGTDALGLLAEVRYLGKTTVDGLVFSWPGTPLAVRESGLYPIPRVAATRNIRVTLTDPGSSSTVVEVSVNGTLATTVTVGSGVTSLTHSWVRALAAGDTVSMEVTEAGTGAANLVAMVRYD